MLHIFFVLTFFACKKDESVIIRGNVAPPDYTIEQVIIDNYINKLYISVLGREPLKDEFDNAIILFGANVSKESRIKLVENVQANDEYFDNLFNIFNKITLNVLILSSLEMTTSMLFLSTNLKIHKTIKQNNMSIY